MSKTKYFFIILSVLALLFSSEAIYVYKNRPVLNSYLLKTARVASATGRTDFAFYILTKGKLQLPPDQNYKAMVKNYLSSIAGEIDLPRVYYDLALISYTNDQKYLTPKLLELSINLDPDFSFWRIELANYYLLNGDHVKSKSVLDGCLKLQYPRQHCQTYMDDVFVSNEPQKVGFLESDVRKIYQEGTF